MKITQEVRDFAAKQSASADTFLEADAGIVEMTSAYAKRARKFIFQQRSEPARILFQEAESEISARLPARVRRVPLD